MSSGFFKSVVNIPIKMNDPMDSSSTVIASYSGETAGGVPHGVGEFTWDEEKSGLFSKIFHRGMGHF